MLRLKDVALRRGPKRLFAQVNVALSPGDRVGVVGANGSGKSSLFAMLRGDVVADAGDVEMPGAWRIAHVAQHAPSTSQPAVEFVIDGDATLRALERALADAEARDDGHAAADLHMQLADHDAYTARSRAESLLLGLGFAIDRIHDPVDAFSGGWRMRLALAQTLMQPSDLLLLDEPTNHLDLDAIVWLEDWLRAYSGAMLVISHDREFLDAVATSIWHLDGERLVRYGGNYSAFETECALQAATRRAAFDKQQREIARIEQFVARFRAKATKARQAQSRLKALERMERIAPMHAAHGLTFAFDPPARQPDPMITLDGVACGYGDRVVLGDVTLSVRTGERIGLVGANGQGKTTLIRTLVGELPPAAGTLRRAEGVVIGYFAQHQIETLRANDTPLEHLGRIARRDDPTVREQALRDFLARFDFSGDTALRPIGPMSGGEKARLALATIVWLKPNLLLLDEPTNHLDLDMRHALTMALTQFEGAVMLVSHDRFLMASTVDTLLIVRDGAVQAFDGSLGDYQLELRSRSLGDSDRRRTVPPGTVATANDVRPASTSVRASKKSTPTALIKAIHELERSIDLLHQELAQVREKLADPDTYSSRGTQELAALTRTSAGIERRLNDAEAEWLEKHAALEAIELEPPRSP